MNTNNLNSLHSSEAGVNEARLNNGGIYSYADELAKYLTCPTTIRSYVISNFGHAPSLDTIKDMQARHRTRRAAFRQAWEDLGEKEHDARPWTVRLLKKPEKPKMELPAPKPIKAGANTYTEVIAAVARYYGVALNEIAGKSRNKVHVLPRRMACYVLVKRGNSLAQVGRWLGGRDHSTILHSIRQFEILASDDELKQAAELIGDRDAS